MKKRLEDLVLPLELCKELPEKAFKHTGCVWVLNKDSSGKEHPVVKDRALAAWDNQLGIPAPVASEILEDLPKRIKHGEKEFVLNLRVWSSYWIAGYQSREPWEPIMKNEKVYKKLITALYDLWKDMEMK